MWATEIICMASCLSPDVEVSYSVLRTAKTLFLRMVTCTLFTITLLTCDVLLIEQDMLLSNQDHIYQVKKRYRNPGLAKSRTSPRSRVLNCWPRMFQVTQPLPLNHDLKFPS